MTDFFSIEITNPNPQNIYCLTSCIGEIDINNEIERIVVPLEWWCIQDYKRQWKEGLDKLNKYNQSCLITNIQNLKVRPFINWWLLYKEENKIYIQNHLLIGKEYIIRSSRLPEFTIDNCYLYIPPRNLREKVIGEFEIENV